MEARESQTNFTPIIHDARFTIHVFKQVDSSRWCGWEMTVLMIHFNVHSCWRSVLPDCRHDIGGDDARNLGASQTTTASTCARFGRILA